MRHAARDLGPVAVLTGVLILLGATAVIGADTMWAVALGRTAAELGHPPVGIPFAVAPSAQRGTPVLLGALVLTAVDALGRHGLIACLLAIDAAVLTLALTAMRRNGLGALRQVVALSALAFASLTAFGVARLPMLSLLPFVALVLLLRQQAAHPDQRIWWAVPLVALWGNLHGGVVIGLAVLGAYLLGARLRAEPLTAVMVGAMSWLALFANPAGLQTVAYLGDVFGNEAAARGSDLWSRPNLSSPLDVLMLIALAVLVVLWVQVRPPLWECLLIGGLALATALAARNGVWLALACVPLVKTSGVSPTTVLRNPGRHGVGSRAVLGLGGLGLAVALALAFMRGWGTAPPGDEMAPQLVKATDGRTVLATEPLVETLAARGARVWLCNPIDSFPRSDQAAFLDFLQGLPKGQEALKDVDVVIAEPSSPQSQIAAQAGFDPGVQVGDYLLWERQPRAKTT